MVPNQRAHPRSRGENIVDKPNILAGLGSSPLTRGKPYYEGRQTLQHRLIPAHAGKTAPGRTPTARDGAHPRSRGENRGVYRYSEDPEGSSPLTRGKLLCVAALAGCVGLIPAHAGKTGMTAMWDLYTQAHPRSRGENRGSEARSPVE